MRKLIILLILIIGITIKATPVSDKDNKQEKNSTEIFFNYEKQKYYDHVKLSFVEIKNEEKEATLNKIWKGKLDKFLFELGKVESGNNDTLCNKYGYIGKWQLGRSALKSVGYENVTVSSFREDRSIFTEEDQYKAVVMFTKMNKQILKNHIKKYEGTVIDGILITESGILAGAHLGGAGGVMKFLDSNGDINKADVNGMSIKHYISQFSGYKINFS